jgi:hypothetical protein
MGMSLKFDPDTNVSGALGTPGYLAPEARDMKPHTVPNPAPLSLPAVDFGNLDELVSWEGWTDGSLL